MDSSSLIIGLFLFFVFVGPLVYLERARKSKAKKFLKTFIGLAEKQGLKLGLTDSWNNYAVGIDPAAHKLFYLKALKDKNIEKVVDLSAVPKCRVVNEGRTIDSGKNARKVIDRLGLAFTNGQPGVAETVLEFYNSDDNTSLTDELPLLEKWQKIASGHLIGERVK